MDLILAFVTGFAQTLLRILPYLVGMGIGFALLSWWSPANGGRPWWKKRGLATDICYWLVVPILQRYGRIGITVAVTVYLLGIKTSDGIVKFFDHGHGPISHWPFWAQVAFYLLVSEFCLYWIHRAFHRSNTLWKFHAVHHASEDLEWISAARFHPVNILLGVVAVDVALLLAGVTPYVFLVHGTVRDRHLGLRARQPQLDPRSVQICDGGAGVPSLAPHRRARQLQLCEYVPFLRPDVRDVLHA